MPQILTNRSSFQDLFCCFLWSIRLFFSPSILYCQIYKMYRRQNSPGPGCLDIGTFCKIDWTLDRWICLIFAWVFVRINLMFVAFLLLFIDRSSLIPRRLCLPNYGRVGLTIAVCHVTFRFEIYYRWGLYFDSSFSFLKIDKILTVWLIFCNFLFWWNILVLWVFRWPSLGLPSMRWLGDARNLFPLFLFDFSIFFLFFLQNFLKLSNFFPQFFLNF